MMRENSYVDTFSRENKSVDVDAKGSLPPTVATTVAYVDRFCCRL
jgi:hypothetical protein